MNKPGLFAVAARSHPGSSKCAAATWVAVGVGMLVLIGLLICATLALVGWLFGQAPIRFCAAPEAARIEPPTMNDNRIRPEHE